MINRAERVAAHPGAALHVPEGGPLRVLAVWKRGGIEN
jgi:hypothetical protein